MSDETSFHRRVLMLQLRVWVIAVVVMAMGIAAGLVLSIIAGRMKLSLAQILVALGGACQFVGVVLVFPQIAELERALRLRPWAREVVAWVRRLAHAADRLVRRRCRNQVVPLSGAIAATSSARGRFRVRPPEGHTARERLDTHWMYLNELQEQLDSLRRELSAHDAEQDQRLISLQERLNLEMSKLNRLIADVSLGSRQWQVVGALLILVGIFLVTLAGLRPTL